MRRLRSATLWLVLAACGEASDSPGPYIPYVPGPGFEEAMQVWVELPDSGPVQVGEWVTLHAARQAGPWVPKNMDSTEEPACEKISPAEREFEVASKVGWEVEPEGAASFNMPGPPEFERQIRFTQPGRYVLRAVSEGCTGAYRSNPVEIVVE